MSKKIKGIIIHWSQHHDGWYCNVSGIGQYVVRKIHNPTQKWIAYRNGQLTSLQEDTLPEIKKAVERVIEAVKGI